MEKWVRGNNLSGLRYQTVWIVSKWFVTFEMNYVDAVWTFVP